VRYSEIARRVWDGGSFFADPSTFCSIFCSSLHEKYFPFTHHGDLLCVGNVFQRLGVQQNEVGHFPHHHGSQPIFHGKEACGFRELVAVHESEDPPAMDYRVKIRDQQPAKAWRREAGDFQLPWLYAHLRENEEQSTVHGVAATIRKKLQAMLNEVKAELQRRMHEPIPEQGKW
jgi:hypothetical protein